MSTEREDADLIEEIAADWLAQREDGFSSAQAREFERWCRLDPRHAAAAARLEQACALLERMPRIRGELQPVVEFPASAVTRAALPRDPAPARARRVPWLVILAAAGAVAALGWWRWPRAAAESVRYTTSAGGYERVLLADGSTVELNAASDVRVRLSPADRRVTLLAGEAHFSVAHDAARPFIVEAGGLVVRAVGTAFNVRLAPSAVEVLVTEGRVTVAELARAAAEPRARPAGSPVLAPALLAANERLVRTTAAARPPVIETVAPAAVREALAWQERKLVFNETPLREVVAQFNRRNRLQVVVGDAALAERPVGGTFAADNVEGFVRLLEGAGDIVAERVGEREIVLRRAP